MLIRSCLASYEAFVRQGEASFKSKKFFRWEAEKRSLRPSLERPWELSEGERSSLYECAARS